MAYLARQERRAVILEAVVSIALKEGLAAATVRRIAEEIDAATGQIHHHFDSASDLRAEAFTTLARRSLEDRRREHAGKDAATRLLALLGYSDPSANLQDNNLWNEAILIAQHDEAMKSALAENITVWHHEIMTILELTRGNNTSKRHISAADSAWRLIALSNGLYGVMQVETLGFSKDVFNRNMLFAIESELLGESGCCVRLPSDASCI